MAGLLALAHKEWRLLRILTTIYFGVIGVKIISIALHRVQRTEGIIDSQLFLSLQYIPVIFLQGKGRLSF